MPSSTQYSLKELAEATGFTGRTIRYYIAEGLIPKPVGLGRTSHYTEDHRDALERVRRLRGEGRAIGEIRLALIAPTPPDGEVVSRSTWEHISLGEDVKVLLSASLPPSRRRHVEAALADFSRAVTNVDEDPNP